MGSDGEGKHTGRGVEFNPEMNSLSADDLRRAIEPELQTDEIVIWVGQPDSAKFSREIMRACLLAVGTIVVLGVISVAVISHFSRFINSQGLAALMAGSMIVYFVIAAPWNYSQRVQRTCTRSRTDAC